MKRIALCMVLVCTLFLGGCIPYRIAKKTDKNNLSAAPDSLVEIETEQAENEPFVELIDAKAVDFVGKTANEVFEVLGEGYEIVGTESGAMQFVCDSCPDMLFCVVPINWDGVNGVEKIEYISPFNGAKANDYLKANMTMQEIEDALSNMPDVQFSNIESYYTEMDDMNIVRYLVQTSDVEFIYEWYEKSSSEPSDSLIVQNKEVSYSEDTSENEEYIYEIATEFTDSNEA